MHERHPKIHHEGQFLRKGTRDTENYSEAGSCFQEPPLGRQERNLCNPFLGGTEHVLDEAAYCRICLEGYQQGNALLNACLCSDQIHQKCLLEWLQHRTETLPEGQWLLCEICKTRYSVVLTAQFCFTCEISKERNSKYRGQFVRSLLTLLLFSGLVCLALALLIKMATESEFSAGIQGVLALPRNTVMAILVMFILFLGGISAGLAYRLVIRYCYGQQWRIAPSSSRIPPK